jgi:hypothetical protein
MMSWMDRRTTSAGTPLLELRPREYRRFLDDVARQNVGLDAAEFERRYLAGELDWSDPEVEMLVVLMGIGQTERSGDEGR